MEDRSGIQTPFKDAQCPTPGLEGDWGGKKGGADIPGGQKGTKGIIPEVTTVAINGAPAEGSSPGIESVVNRKGRG